jgi:hypothetical protein
MRGLPGRVDPGALAILAIVYRSPLGLLLPSGVCGSFCLRPKPHARFFLATDLEKIKVMLAARRAVEGADTGADPDYNIRRMVTASHFAELHNTTKAVVMYWLKEGLITNARKVPVPDRPSGMWLIPASAVIQSTSKPRKKGGRGRHRISD